MSKIILTNASVTVNAIDLSNHASKVTVDTKRNQVDVTAFGATNTEYALGLGDATIAIDFFQDYAASSVDATLWAIYQGGTAVPIVVKADAGATSGTNPTYTMSGLLPDYTPLDGQVGAASTLSVTFINGGTAGITRGTT